MRGKKITFTTLGSFYKHVNEMFEGVKRPYMVVVGTSSRNDPEEALLNLMNSVCYWILEENYTPIGGVSSTNRPAFYQAIVRKEMYTEDGLEQLRSELTNVKDNQ
jgi:hypothetical protein